MYKTPNLKVCGMLKQRNIEDLLALKPDYIGFIFYSKSKRYIVNQGISSYISSISTSHAVKKVGVFVNSSQEDILKYKAEYQLDYIQLHGDESPAFCEQLKTHQIRIIKAFQVNEGFDFNICNSYEKACDYFLFDTKSDGYGGSGKQFDWNLLQQYKNEKPYFLSGGITLDDIGKLQYINDKRICSIDINSQFEDEKGLKKIDKIQELISKISHSTLTY